VNSENKYIGAFREGRKLGKMNLGIESGDLKIESVWCRLAFFSREKWNQKPHRHSFAELHLCLSGNAKMAVGKEEYPLHDVREGDHCWHEEVLDIALPTL